MLVRQQSIWAVQLRARAPRIAAISASAALTLAGLRAVVSPPQQPVPRGAAVAPQGHLSSDAFAESFARAYLAWDAAAPEVHERAVARFLGGDAEPSPDRARSGGGAR